MIFKILTLLLLAASALMAGCAKEVDTTTLAPGGYVIKMADEMAKLVVVSPDGKHTALDGAYKLTSPNSRTVGRFVPSSMNATFEVASKSCGALKYLDTKGGVICESCLSIAFNRANYPNCPLTAVRMPDMWILLNF